MATKRKAKTAAAEKTKSKAEVARQTTFVLLGTLKRVQLMYLRVGELLVHVRDEKLYAELKCPDMETYARERLGLGRASLFNYLRIRDWAMRFHPEWLKPKAKGHIPDLSDVGDLMWLEEELTKKTLKPERRKVLEALREKGLAGKLSRSEVKKVRSDSHARSDSLKAYISKLRLIRKHGSELAHFPPEVLTLLDSAIQILVQDKAINVARLGGLNVVINQKWRQKYLS